MKPREPRRKVLINARMRVGATWHDARILNVSTRGLMLQAANPPPRGSYLEVRRGRHIIVARVIWSEQQRFGVGTQEILLVDALISEQSGVASCAIIAAGRVERRAAPRSVELAGEASRQRSRAMQFSFAVLLGVGAASLAYQAIARTLTDTLVKVETALAES